MFFVMTILFLSSDLQQILMKFTGLQTKELHYPIRLELLPTFHLLLVPIRE